MYPSPNIIKVINEGGWDKVLHVACVKEKKNAYRVLVRKAGGKRPIERSKHMWEYNKVDIKDTRWQGGKWIIMIQRWQTRSAVGMAMNFQIWWNARDLNFWLTISFLWRNLFHVVRYILSPYMKSQSHCTSFWFKHVVTNSRKLKINKVGPLMAEGVYVKINENWSFGSKVEMEVHREM